MNTVYHIPEWGIILVMSVTYFAGYVDGRFFRGLNNGLTTKSIALDSHLIEPKSPYHKQAALFEHMIYLGKEKTRHSGWSAHCYYNWETKQAYRVSFSNDGILSGIDTNMWGGKSVNEEYAKVISRLNAHTNIEIIEIMKKQQGK